MAESERTIKVVDRRLFTAEGELRDEVRAELEASEPAGAASAEAVAPEPPRPPEPAPTTDPSFLRLLDLLAQTASLYLEGMPDPATGRRTVDLTAARQIIDALLSLKDKTRGRLSFEEENVLDSLLGELQLVFTRLAASAGPPKGRGPAVPPKPVRRG